MQRWAYETSPHTQPVMLQMPEFPELTAQIDAAIEDLGGRVAPKFSWSSPHDATWVSGDHSLACSSADEVGRLTAWTFCLLLMCQAHRASLLRGKDMRPALQPLISHPALAIPEEDLLRSCCITVCACEEGRMR